MCVSKTKVTKKKTTCLLLCRSSISTGNPSTLDPCICVRHGFGVAGHARLRDEPRSPYHPR